jgi:hypothetical protein
MLRNNSQKNDTLGRYDVPTIGLYVGPQAVLQAAPPTQLQAQWKPPVCRRSFRITSDPRFAIEDPFFFVIAS